MVICGPPTNFYSMTASAAVTPSRYLRLLYLSGNPNIVIVLEGTPFCRVQIGHGQHGAGAIRRRERGFITEL